MLRRSIDTDACAAHGHASPNCQTLGCSDAKTYRDGIAYRNARGYCCSHCAADCDSCRNGDTRCDACSDAYPRWRPATHSQADVEDYAGLC